MATTVKGAMEDAGRRLLAYQFDHDGFNGLPVRPDVHKFLFGEVVPSGALDDGPIPEIVLNTDGTVDLVYNGPGRAVSLEFRCTGVITFLQAWGEAACSATTEGVIRGRGGDVIECMDRVIELIAWSQGRQR